MSRERNVLIKLKELADRLGLSQTTVSRALNGYPEVNADTRERVLDAARRFDYRPNVSARRLATGRVGAVGAVLQTDRNLLLDPHYVEFLAGLGERLAEDEIDIVLSPARGGDERVSYRRIAGGRRVDVTAGYLPFISAFRRSAAMMSAPISDIASLTPAPWWPSSKAPLRSTMRG